MCVVSIKVAIRKKSGNLFNDLVIISELLRPMIWYQVILSNKNKTQPAGAVEYTDCISAKG